MNKSTLPFLLAFAVGLAGCGGNDPSTPSGNNGSNRLFTAVKEAAPTFQPAAAVLAKLVPLDGERARLSINDQAMMVAYQLLRDYTYPDDEGVVDMSNIYKVLWKAGQHLEEAPSMCTPIGPVADNAISPYAFNDFLGQTYNCGGTRAEEGGYGSSVAYRQYGDNRQMLLSYKWAPDAAEQITIGVIQVLHNGTDGNVNIRFAQAVRYPPGSYMGGIEGNGFAIRAQINGNSATHTFDLKMAVGGTSLVGKGVSRGAGNHFLFRCGDAYYCIPAEATEADLAAITPTDLANVPAEGAAYKDDVSAAVPFDVNTDLPSIDLSDFDLGVGGTPFSYLMF